jgi:threonine dehydrogenase-like Zn-dependent dehydrogenase
MLALQLHPSGPRLNRDQPEPTVPPGEALIRPRLMGVCATDLELCKGYMGFEGVLGHEFVGTVESVNAQSQEDQRWVGKRVVGTINCPTDRCEYTDMGVPEHARHRTVLGILNRDGCFAEAFTLPIANLLEVPEHLSDEEAVFAEPLAAAYEIPYQLAIPRGASVTVLGDGRLGLLCAQVLNAITAQPVTCVGKHEDKLRLCRDWGCQPVPLGDLQAKSDQDIVVDCTGSPSGLTTAFKLVRPRGTLVMKTTVASEPGQAMDLSPIVINELTVLGSRCGPFGRALRGMATGEVDVVSLISRRMKLSDGPAVLEAADQPGVLKVLVEPA